MHYSLLSIFETHFPESNFWQGIYTISGKSAKVYENSFTI